VTTIGAVLTAVCVALLIWAARRPTRVRRLLTMVRPSTAPRGASRVVGRSLSDALALSGVAWTTSQLAMLKVVAGLGAAVAGAALTLVLPLGPLFILALGYSGFIAPTLFVEARAAGRRREAEEATGSLIEWTYALVASGRPVESALATMAEHHTGSEILEGVLTRAARAYVLGAPLHRALANEARAGSLDVLGLLAERLERARDLGQGSLLVLQDVRDDLRAATRERTLARASQVEEKLTLVMTLCYLPALAFLVVIPLFVTLLGGLFR